MNKATDFINKLQNPEDREYYSKLLGGVSEISTPAAGDGESFKHTASMPDDYIIKDAISFLSEVNRARNAAGLPERKIEMPEILDASVCCTIDNMTSLRVEAARLKSGCMF